MAASGGLVGGSGAHSRTKAQLSIVIPAYNESKNIARTVHQVARVLREARIDFEIVVVDDNSTDGMSAKVEQLRDDVPELVVVHRDPPSGFGRAVRAGLYHSIGDVVVPVMADLSEDPQDIVRYYNKITEGYDCVFGTRFHKEAVVRDYPRVKLLVNRIANHLLQILFWTRHNDLTNAFKAYRREVIRDITPLYASHFNVTIEMSLSALIRRYNIATMPISWYGRDWGQSNLRLAEMGRRYLATMLKIWFERMLILDDILAESTVFERKRAFEEKRARTKEAAA